MKIYLVSAKAGNMKFYCTESGARKVLFPYPSANEEMLLMWKDLKQKWPELELFLDSGAYSVATIGQKVDIDQYIKFIHQWKDLFTIYATLDEIGDAKKTWDNQLAMESAGLASLCCFHQGEDFSNLIRIRDKYEYFAVGGIASGTTRLRDLYLWLRDVFRYCPESKIHGFGVFAVSLLKAFPWHSVDTTAWLNARRYGMLLMTDGRQAKATTLGVSSVKSVDMAIQNIKTILGLEKKLNEDGHSDYDESALPGFGRKT